MFLTLGVLAGLIAGSFFNTVADRLPRGQSLVGPRSSCPGCGRRLSWWELVPVVSFVVLRGSCRTCGRSIGWRIPTVELICGGVGLASVLRLGPTWQAALSLVVGGLLVSLAAIDLETRLLPDRLTWPLMGSGLIHSWVWGTGLKWSLAGFLICGGLLWVVGFGYQRLTGRVGLGGGDPKLAAGLGAWLGPEIGLAAVVWGAGAGAAAGLGLVALGRAGLKTALPFGPFLALSGVAWLLIRPPFG